MTTTLTRETTRTAGASGVLEHRTQALAAAGVQLVRADATDAAPRFTGHAAVFNSRTTIGDPLRWGWYEELATSCFDKTLNEGDARFLVDHDTSLLVARVSAGDLRLKTDDIGLDVDSDLDTELSYVRDLVRNLEKRRITGMSFGFYVVRDTWTSEEIEVEIDGKTQTFSVDVRRIDEVRLLEVSAVTFPAYEDTDAGLRADVANEIRTARGLAPRDPSASPAPAGARPAPAPATRDDHTDPAPADATRGFDWRLGDDRAAALQARFRL
jgi:HK97 family phage prohead protease